MNPHNSGNNFLTVVVFILFKRKKKLTEQAYQLARSQEPKGRLSESDILRAIDLLNSK